RYLQLQLLAWCRRICRRGVLKPSNLSQECSVASCRCGGPRPYCNIVPRVVSCRTVVWGYSVCYTLKSCVHNQVVKVTLVLQVAVFVIQHEVEPAMKLQKLFVCTSIIRRNRVDCRHERDSQQYRSKPNCSRAKS